MLVQWQKDFELGQPTTDAEHREVVDLLNELYVTVDGGAPPDSIDRALDTLLGLLAKHLNSQQDAVPMVDHVRDLHRNWRESAATPNRNDLRTLAHWWLEHLCSHTKDC